MIGIELNERLDEDGFGFWREMFEDAPEDAGSALIGFEILLVGDVFGGGEKRLRFD